MRFALLFIFSILVYSHAVIAQQVEMTTEGIDNDGFIEARVIGQDEDGIYVLESNLSLDTEKDRYGFKSRKLRIAYFDGLLKPKWTLPVTSAQPDGSVDQVVYAFNRLLFITAAESKSEPKMEAWIREIGSHGTGPVPGNKIAAFSFERSSDLDKLRFVASAGQQHAMVMLKEKLNGGKIMVHLALLDSTLNMQSVRNISLPYLEKEMTIEDFKLSDNGDLAILVFLNKKEKEKGGDKIKIAEYHLLSIASNAESVNDQPVKSGDKILTQAGLVVDNINHHAVVMGFYNDKNTLSGTGIFYGTQEFEKDAPLEVKTHALQGGQQQKIIGERNSNNSNGIASYPVQKIILRNDGGAVIIAEAAYTSEYSYYDYFTQSLIRHIEYHFDNVIVVSVNSDCSVDWSTVIRKSQESVDDGGVFSSFCPLINSDEIIIIYNMDNERSNSVLAGIITSKGDQRDVEVSKSSEHLNLLPTWGKQISENEVVIPVYQKKKLFLCKISF
jgi:hypothetical protein